MGTFIRNFFFATGVSLVVFGALSLEVNSQQDGGPPGGKNHAPCNMKITPDNSTIGFSFRCLGTCKPGKGSCSYIGNSNDGKSDYKFCAYSDYLRPKCCHSILRIDKKSKGTTDAQGDCSKPSCSSDHGALCYFHTESSFAFCDTD